MMNGTNEPAALKDNTPNDQEVSEERGNWGGKIEFFLTCLSQAVGLGNVWRFPYLAFKHGGGSFLIPYTVMLVVVGMPVLFLEMVVGQYSALGSLPLIKNLAPIFSGIGYAIYVRQFFNCIIYNSIISWTLFYFIVSMAKTLPWRYCGNEFNSEDCFDDRKFKECKSWNENNTFSNNHCYNATYSLMNNLTDLAKEGRQTPSEEYFRNYAVGKTDGMGDFGNYQWKISLCYIACWVLIFLCCSRGIKSIGKVVYFTAIFPYVVLFILLIRGATLEGAAKGVKYFISPEWDKLSSVTVWQEAAVQIFFSLGLASGSMMTFASYNKFNHKISRDAILVAIINSVTSILAGFVVFSVLGFMSIQLDKDISKVATKGPGLAFVVYPDALTRLPVSPLWSILFFFMLITLGLGSQFGSVENAVTCMIDELPHLRPKKTLILFVYCLAACLIGLILCFGNGVYIVDLYFSVSGWNYLIVALLEVVIVAHIYGVDKFFKDVEVMIKTTLGHRFKAHLLVLYSTIIPLTLIGTFILIFVYYEPFKSDDYVFPIWANSVGWIIGIIPLLIILFMTLHKIFFNRELPMGEHLRNLTTPTEIWEKHFLADKAKNEAEISSIRVNDTETEF